MIKWIIFSLCTFNIYAQSIGDDEIINAKKYERVNINQCKADMLGCVPTVRIDGENITLDFNSLDPNFFDGLQKMKSSGVTMGMTLGSYGVITKESGHMPNPMAEQRVFKYVYKTDAVLKICEMDESIEAMGCADSITLKSNEKDVNARADFSKIEISKEDYKSKDAFVIGYFVFEKGHMPNPMVEQHVFKVIKVSFSDAKVSGISDDTSRKLNSKTLFESNGSTKNKPKVKSEANQM
jgi:hypothetical protein